MLQQLGDSAAIGGNHIHAADGSEKAAKKPRDIRLDVFRGLCLVIIFIAHVFDNPWAAWIPARFGFSDATEIFVFCSGMASALAFGRVFQSHGMTAGTARIAYRCWQVYWAHVGLFLAAVVVMALADRWVGEGNGYITGLGLERLAGAGALDALIGVMTLQWVPPFFDILPMYLVILTMVPIVMALSRRDKRHACAFVLGTWALATFGYLDLPADPMSARPWFFNPFAWQLVFFSGFAFMLGWLPAPPTDRRLVRGALAVVVVTIPLAWSPLIEHYPVLAELRREIAPLIDKTQFGLLRYVHFLSLAYLAFVAAGEQGRSLTGPIAEALRGLGQQSLAIFISGLLLSLLAGICLNLVGRSVFAVALVNLTGIALLIGIGRAVRWIKSKPTARKMPSQVPERVAVSSVMVTDAVRANGAS